VNRENTNVVRGETPNSETTAERSDTRIGAFRALHEHTVGGEHILLLTVSLSLKVSDTAGEKVGVDGLPLDLVRLNLFLELLLLEGKPVSDLLAAEGDLTSTVTDVQNRGWVLGLDFTGDAKSTATRSRNRAAGFVTKKWSVSTAECQGKYEHT